MFDVTNRKSFETLEGEIEEIKFKNSNPHIMLILIGNKSEEGEHR